MFIKRKFKQDDKVCGLICKSCDQPFSLAGDYKDQPERMVATCPNCLETGKYLREDVQVFLVTLKQEAGS